MFPLQSKVLFGRNLRLDLEGVSPGTPIELEFQVPAKARKGKYTKRDLEGHLGTKNLVSQGLKLSGTGAKHVRIRSVTYKEDRQALVLLFALFGTWKGDSPQGTKWSTRNRFQVHLGMNHGTTGPLLDLEASSCSKPDQENMFRYHVYSGQSQQWFFDHKLGMTRFQEIKVHLGPFRQFEAKKGLQMTLYEPFGSIINWPI